MKTTLTFYCRTCWMVCSFLLLGMYYTFAQNINFTFQNAQITNDGTDDFYEVDVFIASDTDFMLGSGLLYINYNTAAFGTNVSTNGNLEYEHGNLGGGYILDQDYLALLSVYGPFIQNDNLPNRFAVSFQQALSTNAFSGNNVTATPTPLMHLKIRYQDVAQDPMICFEGVAPFDDQFFTACGGAGLGVDCTNFPGMQITGDSFDCSGAALPQTCSGQMITYTNALGWQPQAPTLDDEVRLLDDYDTAIEGSFQACNLSIEPSTTLTVRANDFIEVLGDIDVTGSLIVEHTGSIVQINDNAQVFNNGTINVNVTTPDLASRDFMVLGSPMTSETRTGVYNAAFLLLDHITANFVPNADVAAQFPLAENFADDNNDFWQEYITGVIETGRGYIVRPQNGYGGPGGIFSFTHELGTLNNGIINFNVQFNTTKNDSPNVLANPYPSAISADDFINANSMIDEVYFWEHLTPPSPSLPGAGSMNFSMQDISMYNLMGGVAAASDPSGTTVPNGIISTSQGFGIKATAAGTAVFNNAMRRTTGNTTLRFTQHEDELNRLWLQVQNDEHELYSSTLIGFTDNATAGMDAGYDSRRLASVVSLFSHLEDGSGELGIQSREAFESGIKVPLGFSTLVERESQYTISISNIEGLELSDAMVYLHDTFTNETVLLNDANYIFSADKGNYPQRFTLLFAYETLTIGSKEAVRAMVFPNPASDMITIITGGAIMNSIELRDLHGRIIRVSPVYHLDSKTMSINLLDAGIYFLTIHTDRGSIVKRFIKY
ncbi:MAG: T9SS type A sorting domain-containing protein [Flavobacteriaceae bacterium]|nr:T9SS type A sorting domain-containing protein [Flavobacteriaceae bacterium]